MDFFRVIQLPLDDEDGLQKINPTKRQHESGDHVSMTAPLPCEPAFKTTISHDDCTISEMVQSSWEIVIVSSSRVVAWSHSRRGR